MYTRDSKMNSFTIRGSVWYSKGLRATGKRMGVWYEVRVTSRITQSFIHSLVPARCSGSTFKYCRKGVK